MKLSKLWKVSFYYLKFFFNRFKPYKIEVNGNTFFVKYTSFWENVKIGKWEPDTFLVFDRFIDANHSFIDMGAWIGPTTLYGAKIAKFCYAIEPDPVAFKNLKKNIELNPALKSKIKIYEQCINDTSGFIKFGNPSELGNSGSSMLFAESKKSILVKALTLQEFVTFNNIKDCNFIKIDIEGGEIAVLPNIKSFLEKNKPTLYLSLHPTIFKDIEKDFKVIEDTLEIYKHIYSNKGELLTLQQVYQDFMQKKINYEIVATDDTW